MVTMSVMYHAPNAPKALLETVAPLARSSWSSSHVANLLLALTIWLIIHGFRTVES